MIDAGGSENSEAFSKIEEQLGELSATDKELLEKLDDIKELFKED